MLMSTLCKPSYPPTLEPRHRMDINESGQDAYASCCAQSRNMDIRFGSQSQARNYLPNIVTMECGLEMSRHYHRTRQL